MTLFLEIWIVFWPYDHCWFLVSLITVAVCLVFWSLSLLKEISCTTAYIYSQKDHESTLPPPEAWVPVSFFFSLSLSLSPLLRLIIWSIKTRRAHSSAWASKTPGAGALCLREQCKPWSRVLLVLCVNQGILASFSLSFSYRRLQTIRFRSIKWPRQ